MALRPLLFWANESLQPDLAIVIVDADGKREERREALDQALQGVPLMAIAAVAVQEFEAWLIADAQALKKLLSQPLSPPKPPEQLTRQQAKELLQQWCETRSSKHEPAELRRQLAEECDLETVSRACPAFERFLADLKAARG